jgi:hypothetical protein
VLAPSSGELKYRKICFSSENQVFSRLTFCDFMLSFDLSSGFIYHLKMLQMKKRVTIVVLFVFFLSHTHAQVPAGGPNNNSVYMGYVIRLISAGSNGFGYDIFFKSKIVVHQPRNPFTLAPTGLRTSDDALKVAHWQVQQLWHQTKPVATVNNLVPRYVAKLLNITIN